MRRSLIFRARGWAAAVRGFALLPRPDHKPGFGWSLWWGWFEIAHVRSAQ